MGVTRPVAVLLALCSLAHAQSTNFPTRAGGPTIRVGSTRYNPSTVVYSGVSASLSGGTLTITIAGGSPVPSTRSLTCQAPLTCDGSSQTVDLTANRTLGVDASVVRLSQPAQQTGSINISAGGTFGGSLTVSGGAAVSHRSVTPPAAALTSDAFVDILAGGTVTLPAGTIAGQILCIKDGAGTAAAAPITLAATGGGTIDGASTLVMATNHEETCLHAKSASSWDITSRYQPSAAQLTPSASTLATAGTGAGTGGTCTLGAGSNPDRGTVTVTIGPGPNTNAILCAIDWPVGAFAVTPILVLVGTDRASQNLVEAIHYHANPGATAPISSEAKALLYTGAPPPAPGSYLVFYFTVKR